MSTSVPEQPAVVAVSLRIGRLDTLRGRRPDGTDELPAALGDPGDRVPGLAAAPVIPAAKGVYTRDLADSAAPALQ